ncbi:MAG: transglycosylase SLT domain-containing protein, partial [Gemmatimonadota bacterium]
KRDVDGPPSRVAGADLVDTALAQLPGLADWRPLVRAELLAPTGDTAAVRIALAQIDPEGEYWSRWGWSFLVDAHEEAGSPERAHVLAREAARTMQRADRAAGAWLRAGQLALEVGDTASAREDLRTALDTGPQNPAARAAAGILDRLPPDPDDDDLLLGEALLASRLWERAMDRLLPLLAAGAIPGGRSDEIRIELGRGLIELGRYPEADRMLASVLSRPDLPPDLTAEALYWQAAGHFDRGAVQEAEAGFLRLAGVAPETDWAERGLSRLLERELETGFGPRARGLLDELLVVGANGSDAVRQIVQLGTTYYLAGDYQEALAVFRRHLEQARGTGDTQQALYWTALGLERIGRSQEASSELAAVHRANPLSFYGVIAGERIGAPVLPDGLAVGPLPVSGLEVEFENALIRLRMHRHVPTTGSFAFELARLTEHFTSDSREAAHDFAEALIDGGFPLQGIVLGREIHDREGTWNLRLLRIVHPFPYRETIVREALARGLDPFFVAGTIRQESMFDSAIRSSAGAVGLMQLMPPTARELARSLGVRYSEDALSDPEVNARLGIAYLADLVGRFDGRAEDVLSAYNAGPSRIVRWRRQPNYGDGDVFVEHIPFAETRQYVKVVQQYTRVYSALYGCGDFEPCLGLSYPEVVARSAIGGGIPRSGLARE